MPIKFLLLGGVSFFFFEGGGSANFTFMGVWIFPNEKKGSKISEKFSEHFSRQLS